MKLLSVYVYAIIGLMFGCSCVFAQADAERNVSVSSKTDRGSLRSVISPREDIRLSTPVEGVIVEYYKKEGEPVTQGEAIVRLDDRMEKAEVERTEAMVMAANAELERAQKDFNRVTTLHNEKIASDKQMEEAVYQLETAKSHAIQGKAAHDSAEVQLSYKTITSPINGIFFKKNKSVGESVTRLEVVARVLDDQQLEMVLYCGPQLFGKFQDGQNVKVKLLDGPEKGLIVPAKVVSTDSIIDAASGTFRTKLAVERSPHVTAGLAAMLVVDTQDK